MVSWWDAVAYYQLAHRYAPLDPHVNDQLGLLLYLNSPEDASLSKEKGSLNSEYYLNRAIQQRPTWPHSWANLMLLKAMRTEMKSDFVYELEKADKFGPWEPVVQMALLRAGMENWYRLQTEERIIVKDAVLRGLQSLSPGQADRIMKGLKIRNGQRMLCPFLLTGEFPDLCQ